MLCLYLSEPRLLFSGSKSNILLFVEHVCSGEAEVGQIGNQYKLMKRNWIFVGCRTDNVWWGLRLGTKLSHNWLRPTGSETYATSRRLSYRGRKVCWYRQASLVGWLKKGKVAGKRRNGNGCRRSECLRISCVPVLSLNVKWFLLRTMC